MKNSSLFVFFLSAFFLSAIALQAQTTHVSGSILNNVEYSSVYLDNLSDNAEVGTSSIAADGQFYIAVEISDPDFFRLRFDDYATLYLVLHPGDSIGVKVSTEALNKPEFTGSGQSVLLYEVINTYDSFERKKDSINALIDKEKQEFITKSVTENSESLVSVLFLSELPEEQAELRKAIASNLHEKYPRNSFVENEYAAYNQTQPLEIGSEAPEIVMNSPKGKEIALSSLRGKVVLIDFWASWCGPCRAEAPNLVQTYNKYKSKGFEIYGVSLDEDEDAWTKGIKKMGLDWIHVSDLAGWGCSAIESYGFDGIPFTVLIDREGKIIATDLRGEELSQKLEEIFAEDRRSE